jgi:hypothetical protein
MIFKLVSMTLIANAGVEFAPIHDGNSYKHVGFTDAD